MTFVSTDPHNHQSENTWFTPKYIIDLFPKFNLDPCTQSYRPHSNAKIEYFYNQGDCGLSLPWRGDVWLNPPYGKEMKPFVDKFIQHKKGVCLLFARMGNENIQRLVNEGAYFYMLRKRVKFIKKDGGKSTNAGADSCLIFFDEKYIDYCTKIEGVLMRGSNDKK